MKHLTLSLFLILGLATSVSANIIMVCDAHENKKRYYKLVQSFSGNNTVEQKVDGQWLDWFDSVNMGKFFLVKGEVYESGASMELGSYEKWDEDYPEEEVVAGVEYYFETIYILDFEFGIRKFSINVYKDKTKAKELKNHNARNYSRDFSCEIQK